MSLGSRRFLVEAILTRDFNMHRIWLLEEMESNKRWVIWFMLFSLANSLMKDSGK